MRQKGIFTQCIEAYSSIRNLLATTSGIKKVQQTAHRVKDKEKSFKVESLSASHFGYGQGVDSGLRLGLGLT